MNPKLIIITLIGIITGMILTVPTLFLSDIIVGGIMVGLLAGVIGHFAIRRGNKEA